MKKVPKGNFGYVRYEKKKRLLVALILFAIPAIIFATGLIMTHTRKNMFTFIAIMGCLPASKSMVNLIMIWLQKPMKEDLYERIREHVKDMSVIYEATVSAYEKNTPFSCIVVTGLNVVGLARDTSADIPFIEKHMKKIIQGNGYKVNVKVFTDEKQFLRRVDELYANREELEANVPFKPNEDDPDLTRNELVRNVILAICI
ncbi:MAG: hypothetical protein ACI4EI_05770 [Muricoprocola sp.]